MRARTRHPGLACAEIAFETLEVLAQLAHIALELLGLIAHAAPAEVRQVALDCVHLPFDRLPHRAHRRLGLTVPLRPAVAGASLVGSRPVSPGDFVGLAEQFVRVSGDVVGFAHLPLGSELLGFHLKLSALLPQFISTRLGRPHDAGQCQRRDQ
jgi:hypothetical protein